MLINPLLPSTGSLASTLNYSRYARLGRFLDHSSDIESLEHPAEVCRITLQRGSGVTHREVTEGLEDLRGFIEATGVRGPLDLSVSWRDSLSTDREPDTPDYSVRACFREGAELDVAAAENQLSEIGGHIYNYALGREDYPHSWTDGGVEQLAVEIRLFPVKYLTEQSEVERLGTGDGAAAIMDIAMAVARADLPYEPASANILQRVIAFAAALNPALGEEITEADFHALRLVMSCWVESLRGRGLQPPPSPQPLVPFMIAREQAARTASGGRGRRR